LVYRKWRRSKKARMGHPGDNGSGSGQPSGSAGSGGGGYMPQGLQDSQGSILQEIH